MKLPAPRMRQFAPWLLVLVSAALAVAAYLQALDYPFISDDLLSVVTNRKLAELHLSELWRLLLEPYNSSFEFLPLRDLSYWIDLALFGLNPAAFRLHNILLYLLCLPLLYATTASLWRYFRPTDNASAPWAAATVTALFAIHPALVESVVWISGRKYILPDFFSLLAIWLAANVKREPGFSSRYAAATLLAFVAVMFSKSSYVGVAPIIAVLWLRFWLDIPVLQRRRSLLLWPLTILLLAAFLLLVFIINNQGFDTLPAYFGIEAITRSLAILGGLTRITVSPEARHFYYPLFEDPWFPAMVAIGGAILVATGWGATALLRERSLAGFTLTAFLLLCLPYLQLIPACPPSLVADRYVSLAIWPVMLLLVLLAWRFKPLLRTTLLLFVALPCLYQTVERPHDWSSVEAFVEHDLHAYPGYYVPAADMTILQLQQGLRREASDTASRVTTPEIRDVMTRLIQADRVAHVDALSTGDPHSGMSLLLELEHTLEQPPPQSRWNTPIIFTLGTIQLQLEKEWQFLAANFPGDTAIRYSAGVYLLHMQKYQDAEINLRAATKSQDLPEYVRGTAFKKLGLAMLGSGHNTEAEVPLRAALEQSPPDLGAYCILSNLYKLQGRLAEAARAEANCPNSMPKESAAQ